MSKKNLLIIIVCTLFSFLAVSHFTPALAQCPDADGDGYTDSACGGTDCDDTDPAVNPGAAEVCDGKDTNCDGSRSWNDYDIDGDGYALCNGECNDQDAAVNPGATEICGDLIDNNCNNQTDEAGCTCPDADGDGHPAAFCGGDDCDDTDPAVFQNCAGCTDGDGDGFSIEGGSCGPVDCDDTDPSVNPGAAEVCDGKDTNCDGTRSWNDYDIDEDGYAVCSGDCNDQNGAVNPDATELCGDLIDNNCNNQTDEAGCLCPDADGDGHPAAYCGGDDCDDTDPTVFQNCPGCTDADGDGFAVEGGNCGPVDCDDTDPNVNPGEPVDVCDGKDTNCDGQIPWNDYDFDGDGYALCNGECDDRPDGADGIPGTADDGANINPGMLERTIRDAICSDGLDNDCDSRVDAADDGCFEPTCDSDPSTQDFPHFFTLLNPDDTVHPDNNSLLCGKCHGAGLLDPIRGACQRCHADSSDPSDPLNGTTKDQYPLAPPYGYGTAPNVKMHSSDTVGTKYGNWTMGAMGCSVCHNPHSQEQNNVFGTDYGMFMKEYICYDNDETGGSVEEFVELTSATGVGSFADGPPYIENVCEMCHTRTNFHRNDGSSPTHYDGQDCTQCHKHSSGFAHGAGGSGTGCEDCHGHDAGYEYSPGQFSIGAGNFQSHSTHTEDDADDLKGPFIDCSDCHDTNNFPYFKSGTDVNGDSRFDLSETDVCDNCHSSGGSYDGVNDATIGAKNNWASGVYSGTALQNGKEMWCVGCHDNAPGNSKPDGSGVSAPNVVGDNSTYGYFATGHGRGSSIQCTDCHSSAKKHIDHGHDPVNNVVGVCGRTGDPVPNPTNYRFYDGKGVEVPHYCVVSTVVDTCNGDPSWNCDPPVPSDFELCLSCHDENMYLTDYGDPAFDPSTDEMSNFRDDITSWADPINLHSHHVRTLTGSRNSTCIFCHDPHGTDRARMINESNMGKITGICYSSNDDLYYVLGSLECDDPSLEVGGGFFGSSWSEIAPSCQACHGAIDPAEGGQPGNKHNMYVRDYIPKTYIVDADFDDDGVDDDLDNCSNILNPLQGDSDLDGIGDLCDNCPDIRSVDQTDGDVDGIGDLCDACPVDPENDADSDGICGDVDTCPYDANDDIDGDSVCNCTLIPASLCPVAYDNCPDDPNADQADFDIDGSGNACDNTCDIATTAIHWIKQFGLYGTDYITDIAIDSSDNIYISGVFRPSTSSWRDAMFFKYDSEGNLIGSKQLNSLNDFANGIAVDSAGNIYIAGQTNGYLGQTGGSNAGLSDIFVHKYDANDPFGEPVWKMQVGTTMYDQAYNIVADNSGNVYVTALTHGDLYEPKTGRGDLVVAKYDTNVDPDLGPVWFQQYGLLPYNDYIPVAMTMDATESFVYIVGRPDTGASIHLYKYATDGTPVYEHISGGSGIGQDIVVDSAGTFYVAGYAGSDAIVRKYDTDATLLWTRTIQSAGTEKANGLTLDPTGNYLYVTGETNESLESGFTNLGYDDVFIAKYDLTAPHTDPAIWVKQLGTSSYDEGVQIIISPNGHAYVTGNTSGALGDSPVRYQDGFLFKAVECVNYSP